MLVSFVVIWYIFFQFWYVVQDKTGNLARDREQISQKKIQK
jgi:hypothetical protein